MKFVDVSSGLVLQLCYEQLTVNAHFSSALARQGLTVIFLGPGAVEGPGQAMAQAWQPVERRLPQDHTTVVQTQQHCDPQARRAQREASYLRSLDFLMTPRHGAQVPRILAVAQRPNPVSCQALHPCPSMRSLQRTAAWKIALLYPSSAEVRHLGKFSKLGNLS